MCPGSRPLPPPTRPPSPRRRGESAPASLVRASRAFGSAHGSLGSRCPNSVRGPLPCRDCRPLGPRSQPPVPARCPGAAASPPDPLPFLGQTDGLQVRTGCSAQVHSGTDSRAARRHAPTLPDSLLFSWRRFHPLSPRFSSRALGSAPRTLFELVVPQAPAVFTLVTPGPRIGRRETGGENHRAIPAPDLVARLPRNSSTSHRY